MEEGLMQKKTSVTVGSKQAHESSGNAYEDFKEEVRQSSRGPLDMVRSKVAVQSDDAASVQKTLLELDALLRARTYEKKGMFKWKLKPSTGMKAILDAIDDYRRFTEDIIDEGSFAADLKRMSDIYLYIISACEIYANTHKPKSDEGQLRLEYVNRIRKLAIEESMTIEDAAGYYKDCKRTDGVTWKRVVSSIRTRRYEDGRNGVTVGRSGGSTSAVYILSGGEKKLFFKQKEPIPQEGESGVYELLTASYRKMSSEYPADSAEYKEISTKSAILSEIQTRLSQVKPTTDKGEPDALTATAMEPNGFTAIMKKISELALTGIPGNIKMAKAGGADAEAVKAAKAALSEDLKSIFSGFAGVVEYIDKNPKMLIEFAETVMDISRLASLSSTVSEARIERGEVTDGRHQAEVKTLAERNVATSRLAEALGISDLIAKSTIATIEVEGRKMTGVAMEEAPGANLPATLERARKAAKPGDKAVTAHYSGKAIRQLMNLQLFDILCGQTDRNDGNILAKSEQTEGRLEVKSVMGIDHDISFGLFRFSDLFDPNLSIGTIKKPQIYDPKNKKFVVSIPHIDAAFANNLMMMSPEHISLLTCDILSEKEREFLCDRLAGLQGLIRLATSEDEESGRKIMLSEDSEWDEYAKLLEEKQASGDLLKNPPARFTYLSPGYFGGKI